MTVHPTASLDNGSRGNGGTSSAFAAGASLVAVGLAVTAMARLPLAWDGAWFFVRAMDTGTPTFLYRRAIHTVLQAPTLAARTVVDDPDVLSLVFSATYALVPLIALLAAWRVVHVDRPEIIVWPILGIALVSLPVQAFFISESTIVAQLAWPLLFAALLGRLGRHRVMSVALIVALAISHPYGGAALAAIGVIAWVATPTDDGDGWSRPVAALLVGTGAVLILASLALRAPYEAEAGSIGRLLEQLRGGVLGPIAIAPIAAWLIGLGAFLRIAPRARIGGIAVLLSVTTAVLLAWALDPEAWATALRYRAWLVFLALPLFAMAIVDGRRPAPWVDRRLVIAAAPAVMAVVLVAQAATWTGLQSRLAATVADAPPGCVERGQVDWVTGTPLDHWGTTSLALIIEGRSPHHLVLVDRDCAGAVTADRVTVKVTPFERDDRPVPGWWGFDDLVAAWPQEP